MSQNILTPIKLARIASDPTGSAAMMYYNSGSNTIKFHNGTTWITLLSGANASLFWRYTATGGENVLSGSDSSSQTLLYTAAYEQVFLNGVMLIRGTDYTATDGSTITLASALVSGDYVVVVAVVSQALVGGGGGGTTTNALTIGTGLSGTSFNGSSAVTITNTGVLSVNGSTGAITSVATTNSTNTFTVSPQTINSSSTQPALVLKGSTSTKIANITAISDNGTVATYTAANTFSAGDVVSVYGTTTISGITFDRYNNTVISATSTYFTLPTSYSVISTTANTGSAYLLTDFSNFQEFHDASGYPVLVIGSDGALYIGTYTTIADLYPGSGILGTGSFSSGQNYLGSISLGLSPSVSGYSSNTSTISFYNNTSTSLTAPSPIASVGTTGTAGDLTITSTGNIDLSTTGTNVTNVANIKISGTVNAGASVGTSGQLLQSTGTGVSWYTIPLTLTKNTTGFSIAGGTTTSKTLTISNTLTLSGTDGSTLNISGGGTLGTAAFTASTAYLASGVTSLPSVTSVNGTAIPGSAANLVVSTDASLSIPTQTGNSGKYLTTNGTTLSWATVTGGSGSGTVTSIIAGTGLTGGTITTSGTIAIDTTVVPQLGAANTFTGNQTMPVAILTGGTTDPTAPSSGTALNVYSKTLGGKPFLFTEASGSRVALIQNSLFQKNIGLFSPGFGSTTLPQLIGSGTYTQPTTAATLTARTAATTNNFTRTKRIGFVTNTTAGRFAGVYLTGANWAMGDGTTYGGFYMAFRFGISDATLVASPRMFLGMSSSVATPTNVEPSTLTNVIGVGMGAADTNLKIFYGGSAAQTPIDLGTNFPVTTATNQGYEVIFSNSYTSSNSVSYQVTNLNTGTVATGTLTAATPGTQLPASTTFLGHQLWRTNNATAAAVGLDLGYVYCEGDAS